MSSDASPTLVPISEVCRRLTLSPASVRSFLATFPEIGRFLADDSSQSADGLEETAVERLALASRARGAGVEDDGIRRILAGEEEFVAPTPERAEWTAEPDREDETDQSSIGAARAAADVASAAEAPSIQPSGSIADRLAAIQEALVRSEERHARERDELTLALLRTQQELQSIRADIGSSASRRQRRRGFMSRLFGN